MPHAPRFEQLAADAKAHVREVSPSEAGKIIGDGGLLIDVREADEFAKEHAVGARPSREGCLK